MSDFLDFKITDLGNHDYSVGARIVDSQDQSVELANYTGTDAITFSYPLDDPDAVYDLAQKLLYERLGNG